MAGSCAMACRCELLPNESCCPMKIVGKLFSCILSGLVFVLTLPALLAATPVAELLSSGNADEAIAALRLHLQTAPQDAETHALLMRAYFVQHRWNDAIAEGQRAVELDPNNSRYRLWLGRAYGEKADHSPWITALPLAKKTHAEFEKAVALNGNDVDARTDLAEYYLEAPPFLGGSKEKAWTQANQVRALGNEAASLWIQAKIAQTEKNYDLAEEDLRKAILASRNNPDTMLNLASFYRVRGRLEDMENMITQAVQAATKTQRNSGTLLDGAELLYRAGRNFTGALQLVRTYIGSPRHSEDAPLFRAYYVLGTILEKMGDKKAAAIQYRAALTLASGFEPAQEALKRVE